MIILSNTMSLFSCFFPAFTFSKFSIAKWSPATFFTFSRFGNKKLGNPQKELLDWAIAFWCGYATQLCRCVPQKGGLDTGVGRSSSIKPNSRILIENPLTGKARCKNTLSIAPILQIISYLQMVFLTQKIAEMKFAKK